MTVIYHKFSLQGTVGIKEDLGVFAGPSVVAAAEMKAYVRRRALASAGKHVLHTSAPGLGCESFDISLVGE